MTSIESGARTTPLVRATLGVAEARVSITDLARRAVAIDEGDAEAHACLSWALNFNGDYQGALNEAQRALLISPNLASAHRAMGTTLIFSGQPRAGRAALEVSIRLDPRDPLLAWHSIASPSHTISTATTRGRSTQRSW